VKYASHFTEQAARGIPEIKFHYFWIVLRKPPVKRVALFNYKGSTEPENVDLSST
jgi:hypothetical protein